jgi:hypothetical protein
MGIQLDDAQSRTSQNNKRAARHYKRFSSRQSTVEIYKLSRLLSQCDSEYINPGREQSLGLEYNSTLRVRWISSPSSITHLNMAGKKGKGKGKGNSNVTNPALKAKEIQQIKDRTLQFINDPSSKAAHWATLDVLKKPAANHLFEDLKRNGTYTGGPNDPGTMTAAGASQPAATTGSHNTSVSITGTGVVPNTNDTSTSIGDPSTSTAEEGNASETEDSEEKTALDIANAKGLVVKVNTDRRMPASSEALSQKGNGVEWNFDDWELLDTFQKLSQRDAEAQFPIRPDFQPTDSKIFTNRFRINIKPDIDLHEFEIVGIPAGLSRRMRRFYVDTAIEMSAVLRDNQDHFATDYNKTIVAWKDLKGELSKKATWSTKNSAWHLVDIKDGEYHMLKLYIKHIRMVNTKALERYVKSDIGDDDWNPLTWNQQADDNSPNKDTVINALNIVISKCFGGGVFQLGANKFFIETGSAPLSDSPLSTIRGYFYSIRPGMGHILLNVNACTSVFLQPVTLDELMSVNNQKLFGKDCPSFLNGLRVYIDYTRGRTDKAKHSDMNKDESRIKKISGLGLPCEEQMFSYKKRDAEGQVESEKQIDVATYLQTGK